MSSSDLPNLVWLRAFEASARLLSFTAAAEELSLTQAAVSHQVRSLEKRFGVALFSRGARRLSLTELGHAYYPTVSQALEDIAFSTRGLIGPQGRSGRRTVTLRAPVSTAVLWIAPRLGKFAAANPQISIRLVSAIWADSTSDDDIDVDVRLGPPGRFSRRAHLLSNEQVIPVARPRFAAELTSPDSLFAQNLLHIHGYQDHWLRLSQTLGTPLPDRAAVLYVDTSLAAIELAASGAGVAMVMERYAELPLKDHRIQRIPDLRIPMGQSHWLMPAAGQSPHCAEVTRVRDWVVGIFQQSC